MFFLIIIIVLFLIALNILCKYIPILVATMHEKQIMKYKIKYPHVFFIE